MDIYVIRHGQSTANAQKVLTGWTQVSLTEKGRGQARVMHPLLENIPFTKVIASDLLRAVQTAQEALPGYEIETDDRLREIDVGSLAGSSYSSLPPEFWENRDYTPYGGESIFDQYERVASFMSSMENEPAEAKIAVVCHEGTIACMLSYVLKCCASRNALPVSNGAVCAFSYRDGVWTLQKWNENGVVSVLD